MASKLDMFPTPCEPGEDGFVKLPPPLKLRERRRLGDESMAQLLQESCSYRVLFKTSQRSRVRIFAEHSRFDMKNHLKLGDIAGRMATDTRNRGALKSTRSNVPRCSLPEIGDQWEEADPPKKLTSFDRYQG